MGALGLGTAACTPYRLDEDQRAGRTAGPTPATEQRSDPDVALAAGVLVAEQSLLDRIDATVAKHPRLERTLAATREGHAAHVALLSDAVPRDLRSLAASPAESPSEPIGVPRDVERAVRVLARAEDDLGQANRTSAFTTRSGSFARVLASMAAAAAQQAVVLAAAPVPGRRR